MLISTITKEQEQKRGNKQNSRNFEYYDDRMVLASMNARTEKSNDPFNQSVLYYLRLLLINGTIVCLVSPYLMTLPHTFEHYDYHMLLVSINANDLFNQSIFILFEAAAD